VRPTVMRVLPMCAYPTFRVWPAGIIKSRKEGSV
jgi:hypothetical protein